MRNNETERKLRAVFVEFQDIFNENRWYLKDVASDNISEYLEWAGVSINDHVEECREDDHIEGFTSALERAIKEIEPLIISNKGKIEMTNSKIQTQTNANKDAVKIAMEIELGKIIVNKLGLMIKPTLPRMAKGYIDHPLAKIAIANILQGFVTLEAHQGNKKLEKIAECAMKASMVEGISALNIESHMDNLLNKLPKNINQFLIEESGDID